MSSCVVMSFDSYGYRKLCVLLSFLPSGYLVEQMKILQTRTNKLWSHIQHKLSSNGKLAYLYLHAYTHGYKNLHTSLLYWHAQTRHTHTHTHAHAHTHKFTYTCICTHALTFTYMYIFTHTSTHSRIYAHTSTHSHIYARIYVHRMTLSLNILVFKLVDVDSVDHSDFW